MAAFYGLDMRWDMTNVTAADYRPGSILRVKMVNFLTYDECEVFPGPRLNVLLGPNGTGKSTVTHAICLACAGSPKTLGRSNDLTQFVKHGKEGDEAYVEVDILADSNIVHTIRRGINAENKGSKWTLDRRNSTEREVKAIMLDLSIDMDNLCSFMPQDRVGEFTRQDSKQILQKTLEAIKMPDESNQTYRDVQIELTDIERAKNNRDRELQTKQNILSSHITNLQSMEGEVARIRQKDELKQLQRLYEIKKAMRECEESATTQRNLQEAVDSATADLAAAKTTIQPLETRERDLRRVETSATAASEAVTKKFNASEGSLTGCRDKIEELDLEIEEISNELAAIENMRRDDEKRCAHLEKKVAQWEQELASAEGSVPAINAEIEHRSDIIAQSLPKSHALNDEIVDIGRTIGLKHDELNQDSRQLAGLRDARQVFKAKISKLNLGPIRPPDIIRAMDWIDQNKHRFRAEVMGPVAMCLDVSDRACAAMLERLIPVNKLFGFVATDEDDARILKTEMRQRANIPVDIYTIKNLNFPAPPFPKPFLDTFSAMGVRGYLSEQVQCPEPIRAFLNSFCSLSTVLWARVGSMDQISGEGLGRLCSRGQKHYRVFVHKEKTTLIDDHQGTKSRYSENSPPSVSTSRVAGYRGIVGKVEGDDSDTQRQVIEERMAGRRAEIKQLEREQGGKREEHQTVHVVIEKARKEKAAFQKQLGRVPELQRSLQGDRRKLNELTKKLQKDAAAEKAQKYREYIEAVDALFKYLGDCAVKAEATSLLRADMEVTLKKRSAAGAAARAASQELAMAKTGLRAKEAAVKSAQDARDKAVNDFKEAEQFLKDIVAEVGGPTAFREVGRKIAEKCPENELALIDDRIEQIGAQLDMVDENPALIARYEEVKALVTQMVVEVQAFQAEVQNAEESLRSKAHVWKTNVEAIADKLNDSFAEFMSELQYEGEVKLLETGMFDEYEIQMKVKFRNECDLCPLSGQRHSGGERAVATIMYLMAMQCLTSVPFRIVDEINQGMDERNERLVFDRIVRSCCKPALTGGENQPQYFLVSPKLLQGLRAMEHDSVTILLVMNGPGVMSKWQIGDFIRQIENDPKRRGQRSVTAGSEGHNNSSSSGSRASAWTPSTSGTHATGAQGRRKLAALTEDIEEDGEVEGGSGSSRKENKLAANKAKLQRMK